MRVMIAGMAPGWLGVARLPGALKAAGFEVAVFGRAGSALVSTRHIDRLWQFPEPPRQLIGFFDPFGVAVAEWRPRILIPGDDLVVQIFHRGVMGGRLAEHDASLAGMIRDALGDPAQYDLIEAKSRLIEFARSLGIRTPSQIIRPSVEAAQAFADAEGYPVILKPDFTQAGQGVRICRSPGELAAAIAAHQPAKSILGNNGDLAVQRFIHGRTLAVTFVALRGEILAAFQFEKLRSQPPETGPVSVARRVDGDDLTRSLQPLIARLDYTGFAGADFVQSSDTGETYLLELNARPTPTIHLGPQFGVDLAGALRAALAGTPLPPVTAPTLNQITLFPQEWSGDARSPFLHDGYHDVPWSDPQLLRFLVTSSFSVPRPP